jgi:regulator of protease activity HflC (stomatin/prohibitin superfamily)
MDDHEHGSHDEHDHHAHALNVIEEPLDPASQSLSDALKASFRVLKAIMLVVVVLFLLSGVFSVGTNEQVIVLRFGEPRPHPYGPGLQFAWPYPIDQKIRVHTGAQTMQVSTFWLNESAAEKDKPLNQREPRGQRLDPATDGALLTGDRGIVHVQFSARYQITDPTAFVQNVADADALLRSALQNAAIAEAAGSTTDDLLKLSKGRGETVSRLRERAQESLAHIDSGITLLDVTVDKSHYPLQTKDAFVKVSTAENEKQAAIQAAVSEQTKELNGVAGEAWKKLYEQIQKLDQKKDAAQRQEVVNEINRILVQDAQGEAGGKIRMAQSRKQEVIARAEAEKVGFEAIVNAPEYQRNPELVLQQFRQKAVAEMLAQKGVSKWLLPAGAKQIMLWLNKDPVQAKQAEIEAIRNKPGAK